MYHDEIYGPPLSGEERWAIGLFEGEGCLTISAGYPRLKLNSTDEDVVRRFHAAVDGLGQVRVDTAQEKRGHKRQWEWYAGGRHDVGYIILRFFDYLSVRRRARAEELLAVLP